MYVLNLTICLRKGELNNNTSLDLSTTTIKTLLNFFFKYIQSFMHHLKFDFGNIKKRRRFNNFNQNFFLGKTYNIFDFVFLCDVKIILRFTAVKKSSSKIKHYFRSYFKEIFLWIRFYGIFVRILFFTVGRKFFIYLRYY